MEIEWYNKNVMNILEKNSYYQIRKDFTLSSSDEEVLSFLYLPILQSNAFSIYMNLYQYHSLNDSLGGFLHEDFLNLLSMSESDFLLARRKLEGIGLLEVYQKRETDNANQIRTSYIYFLLPPASPKKFFHDLLLRTALNEAIGNKKYNFLYHYFQVEAKKPTNEFQNITTPFKEVFQINVTEGDVSLRPVDAILEDKSYKQQGCFDTEALKRLLEKFQYPVENIKNHLKEIENLCILYEPKVDDVANLILQNTDTDGIFYFDTFQKDIRNLRQFSTPKKTEEKVEYGKGDFSKVVEQFNKITPDQYLFIRYNAKPAAFMLKEIENLKTNLGFSNGIINVILDYCFRKLNGEFNSVYIEKVAYTLSGENVKNAYDAMTKLSSRDFEQKQVTRRKKKPAEAKPKQEEKEVTKEEINSLEDFIL